MTALTILPNIDKKRLKFFGPVASGEHVAVTVSGAAGMIAPAGEGQTLRLRVLFGDRMVAMFPLPPREGESADAWSASSGDAVCELNLNTVPAARLLKFGGTCLWILDDAVNHTLYGMGEHEVLPWPRRRGVDVPYNLDEYPDIVSELREEWAKFKAEVADAMNGKPDTLDIFEDATKTRVRSDILPSYVDEVLEFDSLGEFPRPGEDGKIYVAKDTNKTYRWSGSEYIQIGGGDDLPLVVAGGKLCIQYQTEEE